MAKVKIEGSKWTEKIAGAVEAAKPGDTITVPTWYAAQLACTAALSIHGKEHGITIECGGRVVEYLDADDPPEGSGFDGDGYPVD